VSGDESFPCSELAGTALLVLVGLSFAIASSGGVKGRQVVRGSPDP
jgi:hypothetical protein